MNKETDVFQKVVVSEKNWHISAVFIVGIFILAIHMGSFYCSLLMTVCHFIVFNELISTIKNDTS